MRVRVICHHVPGIGLRGAEKAIDNPSARTLIMLGKVERVPAVTIVVEPTEPQVLEKPRRTYKRRDIVAEPPVPEPVAAPWDDLQE